MHAQQAPSTHSQQTHDQLFIDGEWVTPSSSSSIPVINATTSEPLGSVPCASTEDIDSAVNAARNAFDNTTWSNDIHQRATKLKDFANVLETYAGQLATTVTQQNGMPSSLSTQLEGGFSIALLRYFADLIQSNSTEERRNSPMGSQTLVGSRPIGVAAAIVPWNYPVTMAMTKIAPALAAGCTAVVKPSPQTPLDHYIVARAAAEAGIPPGVLNFVPAETDGGSHLVQHPKVDVVAFTGSTETGRRIGETCGRLLRPASLELGGKSAAVILDDADINEVVGGLYAASLWNNGQTCTSCSRILVPSSRYNESC